MKIQNATGEKVYQWNDGVMFLNSIIHNVQHIETLKTISKETQVTVSKTRRLCWSIFWLLVFWPFLIVIYFFCGYRTKEVFIDGEFHVTMKDGSRFIIFATEQYVLDWIAKVNQAAFLGQNIPEQSVVDVWAKQ